MRFSSKFYDKIFDKYATRLDEDGLAMTTKSKDIKGNLVDMPDPKGMIDPAIIWCGPFLDGLEYLGIFSAAPGYTIRRRAKTFFFEVSQPDKPHRFRYFRVHDRAGGMEWPYEGTPYRDPLDLVHISGAQGETVEPGGMSNSPTRTVAGGSIWESHTEYIWDPEITLDPDYELHIMRRGDKIVTTQPNPNPRQRGTIEQTFVLRPPSEGTSLMPAMVNDVQVTRL